ncbi:zf-C3HC-domain-containing protein [Trametes versicolor FP-101664 SS1]|uniref:zf-C3HC-domain-containing protein n=1 Tax=Trametes versicolor (strain FP-101664) TaxID=717944 RepID=UPI00046213BB|nr:zf-C3HC-domain-containing protein [Trametes versicolor FP-101664 SS1]EIW57429.1 zf-C3HC-domain-containing protein [Trametes versicolor FP-101664 SS1]
MAEQVASQSTLAAPTGVSPQSSEKTLKRKLEDALQTLDEAVGPTTPSLTRPPPLKRLRTARSIYSTLAKYGIKKDSRPPTPTGDLERLSKTAPHLAAILTRTATRTRKALPFRFGQPTKSSIVTSPSTSDYRPSSTASFLARLSTYKLSTYGNKPPAIDAVAASKCGWINDGKDRLVCGLCGVSWVVGNRDGMTREAANALVEKQRVQLIEAHKEGCPWKTRQCDDSIYHVPLQAPLATIRDIKSRAVILDTVMSGVEIKHPLTAAQIHSILSIITSVSLPSSAVLDDSPPSTPQRESTPTPTASRSEPSEVAVLTAFFGWSILPPASFSEPVKTPSLSRATSVMPATPSRAASRASSVARDGTPTPSTPRPAFRTPSTTSLNFQFSANSPARADTTLLHCTLCQRRVGLWAFLPKREEDDLMNGGDATEKGANGAAKSQQQRQLDILREHRPYCPYVVRSTTVPSLPTPPSATPAAPSKAHQRSPSLGSLASTNSSATLVNVQPSTMEGWRAVLTVVSRYGTLQRQRLGLSRAPSMRMGDASESGDNGDAQVDPIEAMVADVKSRGGRDLLKYVKGLLG